MSLSLKEAIRSLISAVIFFPIWENIYDTHWLDEGDFSLNHRCPLSDYYRYFICCELNFWWSLREDCCYYAGYQLHEMIFTLREIIFLSDIFESNLLITDTYFSCELHRFYSSEIANICCVKFRWFASFYVKFYNYYKFFKYRSSIPFELISTINIDHSSILISDYFSFTMNNNLIETNCSKQRNISKENMTQILINMLNW